VSIRVVPQGGSAAAGLGTTTYEDGIVLYAPTQAETNYEAFCVIAYKTGCIPASTTVVTSASPTAGYGGVDWSKVTAATTTVNLSGTTIATSQAIASVSGAVGSVTGNVGGNVVGSVGSISGVTFPGNFSLLGINASGHISRVVLVDTTTTNSDMRGTDGAALASVWTATVAGRIDAAISTRSSHSAADVWSVATRTLTAFSFSVTVGTNNDKTGYSLATAPLDASGTAAAVWGALLASYTTADTFGARVVRSTNSNNSVAITGANHVAADIHELQPAVIQATHFSLGAVDANALAADAASKIASAVRTNLATELGRIDVASSTLASQSSVNTLTAYVDTEVAAIKAKTDALPANPAATSDIPSAITIADAVLSRSVANVEGSAAEHTLCTLVLAALEGAISGNTWTIKRSNGSTTHYVKTVTADANASPIVSVQ
jgi:hypothetical protein